MNNDKGIDDLIETVQALEARLKRAEQLVKNLVNALNFTIAQCSAGNPLWGINRVKVLDCQKEAQSFLAEGK